MGKKKETQQTELDENIDKVFIKQSKDDLEEYILEITEKYIKQKNVSKKILKNEKINSCDIEIPSFSQNNLILKINYNVNQLKSIAKHYKLKVNGNKEQLISRIYSYLMLSTYILKIQKSFRTFIQKKYNKSHGPAYIKRDLCNNSYDFFTMDELKDISCEQFFSYKDSDGFIYGFDILSIHNLIYKCNGIVQNPYNRRPITPEIINNYKNLIKLSRILKINICTDISNIEHEVIDETGTDDIKEPNLQ
jgi:hypothetical protein